jgi:polyphenol oxidase
MTGTPDSTPTLSARLADAHLDWLVADWAGPPSVGTLVTTRSGGVSRGPYATMNLGFATAARAVGDPVECIAENRRRLGRFLPSAPIWLDQVHGTAVATLEGAALAAARATPPVADAAVTRERGIVCAVLTADCLPVLFADRHGRAVGIAHAGWRGLAAGVLEATIDAFAGQGVAPHDLVAWLGPAIGPAAFQVGADVVAAFGAVDARSASAFAPDGRDRWRADIYRLARQRLAAAGIDDVAGGDLCTHADAVRFYSYRRERETGRMAALVWLEPLGIIRRREVGTAA